MDVLLMVDPADEKIVGEAIETIDKALVSGPPQPRKHLDATSVIAFALQAAKHLDAVSVLVGALLAKHIKVHIEVGGIPLTAKTLKEGLGLIRKLQGLLGEEPETPKTSRKRK